MADRIRSFVTVKGNVWVEGEVGHTPGMKLSDAIRLAGGPKPDVYLDRILVTRAISASWSHASGVRPSARSTASRTVMPSR